ncbi:MAG: sulfite exporter TauE/SafE family protein [Solirubrobacterales bacterium]
MSALEAVAILAAGVGAGTINTVVGSGSLITFPVLVAFGYSPLVANVTNTVGIFPGSLSGAIGYRRELQGQRRRMITFGAISVVGGITGAVLLLALPEAVFDTVVPIIVGCAVILVLIQPSLNRRLEARDRTLKDARSPWTQAAVYGSGIYGGYFGAAQGVLLIGILGTGLNEPSLQRVNALKNVLAMLVNFVSAIVFVFAATVAWGAAALIAAGAVIGGQIGAGVGRKLPQPVLRGVIVVVGVIAIVALLT